MGMIEKAILRWKIAEEVARIKITLKDITEMEAFYTECLKYTGAKAQVRYLEHLDERIKEKIKELGAELKKSKKLVEKFANKYGEADAQYQELRKVVNILEKGMEG